MTHSTGTGVQIRPHSSLDPRTPNIRDLRKWRVWKDDSEVKSSGYSSTGPIFGFEHLQGSLQLCVTPVPEDPTPSSGFHEHQLRKQYKDMHSGKAPRCIKGKEKNTERNWDAVSVGKLSA